MKTNTKFDYKRFLTENMLETNMAHSDVITEEVKETMLNLLLKADIPADAIEIEGHKDTDGYTVTYDEEVKCNHTFQHTFEDQGLQVDVHLYYNPSDYKLKADGGCSIEVEIYPPGTPMDYDKYTSDAEVLEQYLKGYKADIIDRLEELIDDEKYNSHQY